MADTNLEQTVFEYSPITPIRFTYKPNKYVLKAEEFNNYMHGLTTACGSYYTCIKELQQKFDSLTVTGVKDNSIITAHLKDGIVTSEKIALQSIEDKHIAQNTISPNKISAGAFYQLLRKTFGATSSFSASAVEKITNIILEGQQSATYQYTIPNSSGAQGIVLQMTSGARGIATGYSKPICHVLFSDGFRISLTNPLDQGWSDDTKKHILAEASRSDWTAGLAARVYPDGNNGLILDYTVSHFTKVSADAEFELYYALF